MVSIITVCLNAESVIEKTLKSVIEQDFLSKEYIVIDGESTDGTIKLIQKYREDIDVLICEKDSGIYNAMNKGIYYAEGKWTLFLNAGDTFASPSVLSHVFDHLETDALNNADVIYGNTIQVRSVGNFILPNRPLNFLLKGMPFCHQSAFVKTILLKDQRFNEKYQIVGDFEFLRNLYLHQKTFLYVPIVIACFEAEQGISAKRRLLGKWENAKARGINNTLNWKFYYLFFAFGYYFKLFYKSVLPRKLINSIRHFNYRRKEKRKYS